MTRSATEDVAQAAFAKLDSAAKALQTQASHHWYVGFSGGLDSTVLLDIICRWRHSTVNTPTVTALHINHGLQSCAEQWEQHCQSVCDALSIPLIIKRVTLIDQGKGLEAAARSSRYQVFEQQLQVNDLLLLGHHLDDQVETFFLRLMRGAGVEGLAGMPEQRVLGQGHLLRPMLSLGRNQLQQYAEQNSLAYIEDPSNQDQTLDRNYLRQTVLPLLEQRWPAYRATVTRAAGHLAAIKGRNSQFNDHVEPCVSLLGDPGIKLDQFEFESEVDTSFARILRSWLRSGGYQVPDTASLSEYLRQLKRSDSSARPLLQTSEYCLQRFRNAVYLFPVMSKQAPPVHRITPGQSLQITEVGEVSLQLCDDGTEQGIWLVAGEALQLRWRRGGEHCHLVGAGHSRSLKKLLHDKAVPPWWRNRVPLLYAGDELLAVAGLGTCISGRSGASGVPGQQRYILRWKPTICGGFD